MCWRQIRSVATHTSKTSARDASAISGRTISRTGNSVATIQPVTRSGLSESDSATSFIAPTLVMMSERYSPAPPNATLSVGAAPASRSKAKSEIRAGPLVLAHG